MDDEEIELLSKMVPPGIIDPNTRLVITSVGEIHIPEYPPVDNRTPIFSFDHLEDRPDGRQGITDPRLVIEDRNFTEVEKSLVKTTLTFVLPYRLSNFDGTWDYGEGPLVSLESTARDAKLAAMNLGFRIIGGVDRLTIDPDDQGHCGKTTVYVMFKGHEPIKTLDDQKTLLARSLHFVNMLIDWYCLSKDDFGKHRLAPSDVSSYRTGHGVVNGEGLYNMQTVYLPSGALLTFEEPPTDLDAREVELIKARFKLDRSYRLAFQTWVEARRALYTDNALLAVIQGSLSLEIALFHFLRSSFIAGSPASLTIPANGRSGAERVELDKLLNSPKRISLDKALNRVLPEVLAVQGHEIPSGSCGCDRIRVARNEAIHETDSFEAGDVEGKLDDVKAMIEFLKDHHPR